MKQVCEEVMVLHLGSLDYMHYVLNIRFYGLKEFHKRYYIRDIIFYVSKLRQINTNFNCIYNVVKKITKIVFCSSKPIIHRSRKWRRGSDLFFY